MTHPTLRSYLAALGSSLALWLAAGCGPEEAPRVDLPVSAGQAISTFGPITGLSGTCVDIAGGNTADSTPVQTWSCNGSSAQQWAVQAVGVAGPVKDVSGKCLDAQYGSSADGTLIQLYTCNGTVAQQWTLTSAGELKGPGGKCLDIPNSYPADGTQLILWTCHGGANQRWSVTSPSASNPWTLPPPQALRTIHVAVTGNDSTGDGSQAKPFATPVRASHGAQPGDRIVMHGGTYRPSANMYISVQGTAERPIWLGGADNEKVIIDGSAANVPQWQSLLTIGNSNHVVVDNIELANSPQAGLGVWESTNVVLQRNIVHDTYLAGIPVSGENITVAANRVYRAALSNLNGRQEPGGWPAAINTYGYSKGPCRNIRFVGNEVHDIWGEGLIALSADGVLMEDNRVRNTFSMVLYVDNARNVRIHRNHLVVTTDAYNRLNWPRRAHGVGLGVEYYDGAPQVALDNIVISNNVMLGVHSGVVFWSDGRNTTPSNTYSNIKVLNSVMKDLRGAVLEFHPLVAGATTPRGCVLANSVLYGRAGTGADAMLSLAHPGAWSFSHNDWPDGIPTLAREPNSFALPPGFVDAASPAPEGFRLSSSSPCIRKGRPLADVTVDFWNKARSPTTPSIGVHEY